MLCCPHESNRTPPPPPPPAGRAQALAKLADLACAGDLTRIVGVFSGARWRRGSGSALLRRGAVSGGGEDGGRDPCERAAAVEGECCGGDAAVGAGQQCCTNSSGGPKTDGDGSIRRAGRANQRGTSGQIEPDQSAHKAGLGDRVSRGGAGADRVETDDAQAYRVSQLPSAIWLNALARPGPPDTYMTFKTGCVPRA